MEYKEGSRNKHIYPWPIDVDRYASYIGGWGWGGKQLSLQEIVQKQLHFSLAKIQLGLDFILYTKINSVGSMITYKS